jgi:hypothetical protein
MMPLLKNHAFVVMLSTKQKNCQGQVLELQKKKKNKTRRLNLVELNLILISNQNGHAIAPKGVDEMTLGSNGLVDHMPFFFSLTILE